MEFKTQITKGGRLVVPAKLRKALQIEAGDEVVLRLENGSLRLIPLHQAVRLAQETIHKYAPKGVSLVDELIQARRAEARDE
ncbi:MAG: AbrB/MazE/SpoVT family DNA-binding domain-containing protein [Anaerolineales bacterium]|nr:AbrB/MazE/SpoVT family DNA-binding domain-containing protein [Anaerolineales bacterium]